MDVHETIAVYRTKHDSTNQNRLNIFNMVRSVGEKYSLNRWVLHTDQVSDVKWRKLWHSAMKYNFFQGYVSLNDISRNDQSKHIVPFNNATLNVAISRNLKTINRITNNNVRGNFSQAYGDTVGQRDIESTLYLIQSPDNANISMITKSLKESEIEYIPNIFYFTTMAENKIGIYYPDKTNGKRITGVDIIGSWTPELGLEMQDPDIWFQHISLEGRNLRVVSVLNPPFVTHIEDNCTKAECFKGIYPDMLHDLSRKINFTYTIERVYKWSTMIDLVHDGYKDIAVGDITVSKERSDLVRFLPILNEIDEEMFLRNPIDSLSLFAYLQPFTQLSWVSVVLFAILIPPILTGMVLWGNDDCKKELRLSDCYWFVAETLLLRSNTAMPTTYSNRISFVFVLFGSFMIYIYWEAMLISFLAVKKTQLPFQNLEELADSSSYRLLVGRGTLNLDRFRYSSDPARTRIWNKQIEPNLNQLPLVEELIPTILDNPNYLLYEDGLGIRQSPAYLKCDIVNIFGPLRKSQIAWIMPKNSPFFRTFHYHLKKLKESGIVERYQKMYVAGDQVCPDFSGKSVSLKQCFSAFLVFIPGVFLSMTWFMLEKFAPTKWIVWLLSFGNEAFEMMAVKIKASNVLIESDQFTKPSTTINPKEFVDVTIEVSSREVMNDQYRLREMQQRIDQLVSENISLKRLYKKDCQC